VWHNAALSALLLAKSSALQTLNIRCCGLCDAGLGPVVEALRHNTHMTNLDCSDNNALDAHIARARDPRCSLLAPTAYARASARSGLGLQCVASVAAQRCQGRLLNALQRWRKRSWSSRRTRGGRHPAISASWRALWRALCAAR
jgi:hypothetical protein